MKKIYLFAAASLMLASCAKDIVETPSTETDDTEKGYVTLTFTASHPERTVVETPSDDPAGTKTILNETDGMVTWKEGDQLKLIIEGDEPVFTKETVISEDGKTATFKATIKEGQTVKYAVYPSSIDATLSGDYLNVTVPNVQDGTFENASIEVGTVSEDNEITLKNVCSLLKFTVVNEGATKVFLGGNGAPFAGTAKVNAGILAEPYTNADDVPDYFPNVEINVNGPGTYYAAILPAKTTGLSMQIYDGSNEVLAENISSNVLDAGRKTIKDLGTLKNTKYEEIFFVSNNVTDGGDGKSWDTAWNPTTLFSELNKTTFKGTVIIVEGGDMKLNSEYITLANNTKFKMYGGYPKGLEGRDITSRDLVKYQTNFWGNKASDDVTTAARIFSYQGNETETRFDGIGFCNTYQNVGGEQYTGTALLIGAAKNAHFVNCRIFKNRKDGNAIVRVGGTSAIATFERCIFSDNIVSGKGLIQVQKGGNLTIRDCDFSSGNTVSGETADAYKDHYRVCYKYEGGTFKYEGDNKFANNQFIPEIGKAY